MEDSVGAAYEDLRTVVSSVAKRHEAGHPPEADDLEQIRASVLRAAGLGASAEMIAVEGHLSVNWVRDAIDAPEEVLRDRSGNTMWVI